MYFSACIPALFPRIPAHEAVAALAPTGIPAFELWGWWDLDLDALAAARERTGLRCSAICTRFIPLNDAARREDYLAGLRETVVAAKRLDCDTIISQVGGEIPGVPRQAQHDAIVEGLRCCAPLLAEAGMQLVIEPLNTLVDHKGYYLSSSGEGFDIIREVDSSHVRLLYDVYHQQITEGNLLSNIAANLPLIGHMHIAGVPGRHEVLGEGEINYPWLLARLAEMGYAGAVGLEYFPQKDAVEGIREILALKL